MQGVSAGGALGDPGFVEPAATYDATGTWDYTTTNNWASGSIPACTPEADETGTITITQTGNNFTLVAHGDTLTGTVSGATYTIFSSETGASGTDTMYITFTVSSSSSGSGTITWSGTDGVEWCEGGAELTFTKPTPPPAGGGGGGGGACFIATAAYGSYMESHVKVLRDFRDRFLLTNTVGKVFVDLYYTYSPPVADFISNHNNLRLVIRWSLLPIVGTSCITLQLGMWITLVLIGLLICFMGTGVMISLRRMRFRSQV